MGKALVECNYKGEFWKIIIRWQAVDYLIRLLFLQIMIDYVNYQNDFFEVKMSEKDIVMMSGMV